MFYSFHRITIPVLKIYWNHVRFELYIFVHWEFRENLFPILVAMVKKDIKMLKTVA